MASTQSRRARTSFVARVGGLGALMASVTFASCSGETTAPVEQQPVTTTVRVTANFPAMSSSSAFASQLAFDRAHIVVRRANGSTALDTTVNVASSVRPLNFDVSVRLPAAPPAQGEAVVIDVRFLNAAGATVFRAGPTPITLGAAPAAVVLDAAFIGSGASATRVAISPRTLSVNAGADFALSASATDANGATIPNAPIEWVSLDSTRATISSAGAGKAQLRRGAAGIVARSITGRADTVFVDVKPVPGSIVAVSGGGQIATIGTAAAPTLAQPLVVKVTATDGLPLSGVTVQFAAPSGSSLSPAIAATDSNGIAHAAWTLANVAGVQTATARVPGLSGVAVAFTATGHTSPATALTFLTLPGVGNPRDASQAFTVSVAAVDAAGDIVRTFVGTVTLALGVGLPNAVLGGVTSVPAIDGIARFEALTLAVPSDGYVLIARSAGLTPAATPAFSSGMPQAGSAWLYWSAMLGSEWPTEGRLQGFSLVAYDGDRPQTGIPVTFSASNGGSVTPASAVTDGTGSITMTWTLGAARGLNTLTASSPGRVPVSLSVRGIYPSLSTVFSPPTLGARQHHLPDGATIQMHGVRDSTDFTLVHTNPASVSIPASPIRMYTFLRQGIVVHGLTPGVDTITVSAPRYNPGTSVLRVTLPVLSVPGLPATATRVSQPPVITITARDEAGHAHLTSDEVVVHAVSSDTTVLKPTQKYFRIPMNASSVTTSAVFVGPGRARITYSDSGGHSINYVSATTNDVVVSLPSLVLGGAGWAVGMNQNATVSAGAEGLVSQPLAISLSSSDTTIVTVPSFVTFLPNTWEAPFRVYGRGRTGTAQITASAPGYAPVTREIQVTRPYLWLGWARASFDYIYTTWRENLEIRVRDEQSNYGAVNEDLVVSIRSLTPDVVRVDSSSVTVRAGLGYTQAARAAGIAPGTARIVISDERDVPHKYAPDTITFSVYLPPTVWYLPSGHVGVGQYVAARISLAQDGAPTTIPITHAQGANSLTPASVIVPAGQREVTLDITGLTVGTDTITVSPPGHAPARFSIVVGTGRFRLSGLPASLRTSDSVLVTVAARNPTDVADAKVAAATVITVAPSSGLRIVSGASNSADLTSVTIPANASSATFYVKGAAAGAGTLTLTSSTYTPLAASVTITP